MPAQRNPSALDWITLVLRWALGAFFVYSGIVKALHPEEFLKLARQYDLVSNYFLLNCAAAALPWFEVFCGVLLLGGVAVRGAAVMIIAMLVPFTLLVAHRAWAIAEALGKPFCTIRFDCGCGTGEVLICFKIVENAVLLLIAAWLLAGRGRLCAARFELFERKDR